MLCFYRNTLAPWPDGSRPQVVKERIEMTSHMCWTNLMCKMKVVELRWLSGRHGYFLSIIWLLK